MRSYTTQSPIIRKTGSAYKLARVMSAKYFPQSPLDGTYVILDLLTGTVEGTLKLPLTINNGI